LFEIMKRPQILAVIVLAIGLAGYAYSHYGPATLVLTGMVTTNDVIVSSQVGGQIGELRVREGDTVRQGDVVATIVPDELKAETDYYSQSALGLTSQVHESQAALRLQERQLNHQTTQAQAALLATEAEVGAGAAEVAVANVTFNRTRDLASQQIASSQDLDRAKAALDAALANLDALRKKADAQREAVALARANAEEVTVKRSQVETTKHQEAAASAQSDKAAVRLGYAALKAPINGVVDVRAARAGEYVNAGQPVLTLVNPDDLWVRADVEESYIDRVRAGDTLTVRFPSGEEREATVFHRGVDAGYATQRDVSRTKRDIKTFEIRLRVDNKDRRLALGMTAYVMLPVR
jgi:HlyD family secretion protein